MHIDFFQLYIFLFNLVKIWVGGNKKITIFIFILILIRKPTNKKGGLNIVTIRKHINFDKVVVSID